MIKKIATIMALALSVSMVGMVPASALGSCNDSLDTMEIVVNGGDTVWLAVDDDVVYCDTDDDPFAGGTEVTTGDDSIDSIDVEGDGTLVIVLADVDNDDADWSIIDDEFNLEDFDGTLVFDGSSVEDGSLSVRFGSSTVSFSGTTADYDDLDSVSFLDGEESDLFDGAALDVPVDVTLSNGGHDVAIGGDDEDTFLIEGSEDDGVTVRGNGDDDTITENRDDDDVCDTVYGGSGNDDITMQGDCDTVFPGSGNDDVAGATTVSYADVAGAVSIVDDGDDSETGLAAGDDEFADAPEVFIGSSYGDTIVATEDGDATLFGGAGNDTIRTANSNKVYGGAGADLLIGSDSVNYLYGNAGADTLRGKRGNDYLMGGAGLDSLYGGRGADVCGGEVLNTCEFIR